MTPQEFTDFCRTQAGPLYGYLIRSGARPYEAEDVIQDTLAIAWTRHDTVDHLRAYAYTTALRLLHHAQRTHHVEEGGHDFDFDDISILDQDSDDVTIQHRLHRSAVTLISELPGLQRQVMALAYDGYTPAETATLLGTDPNNVRVTLHHARRKLRTRLRALDLGILVERSL